jgi:group I intron endonuclease
MNDIIALQNSNARVHQHRANDQAHRRRIDMSILSHDSVSGIYKITNTKTGHCYIGSAVNIKKRWNQHLSDLRKNKHHSIYMQRSWNKWGEDCFKFSILETCFIFVLLFREQHYINLLKPVYNFAKTAGSQLGMKRSNEARAKMAAAHKGKTTPPETRAKLSERGRGHVVSLETREKLSRSGMGHDVSDETKKKLSAASKKQTISAETRAKISETNKHPSPETRLKKSAATKGSNNPFFGRKHTNTSKEKMSLSRLAWLEEKAKKENAE